MVAPPAIGGSSLGGKKDTASCFRCHEEEPNEEEDLRMRIWEETITKSSAPLWTVIMFKMLPQTDNQCSKVDVKHGNGFGVQSVTYMWIIEMIATSSLAAGGITRGMEVTRKRLQTRSPLLSWRRGKMQVISWTKRRINSSILERISTPRRWRLSSRRKKE